MKNRMVFVVILVVSFFLIIAGCSTKMGGYAEKTHFAYPNSNVKPLGAVDSTLSKTTFIIPPTISADDVRTLIGDALKKKPGADLIINYSTDTKLTIIPIPIFSIYTMEMTLSGTAVSMEVGRKELQDNLKKFDY